MAKANLKIEGHDWNFATLWNQALDSMPQRPMVKRNHIWASELGGSYLTRYLRMNCVPYTNPPNARSRRKFMAGDVWEWIIKLVLTMCGVLKAHQVRGEVEIKGMLKVTGRLDFIAGGPVDWEKAKEEIKRIQSLFAISVDEMPSFIFYAINHIVADLEKQFTNRPLKEIVFEAKSVSSFMAQKVEKCGAMPPHILQTGHYLIADKRREGIINYICKDDTICQQFTLENNPALLKAYKADVKTMTEYFNNGFSEKNPLKKAPPADHEVLFDGDLFRFHTNFNVEYSPYLTLLYQYKNPEEYRLRWTKMIASWNRTFKRCVRGDKMTPLNSTTITEVVKVFPMWDKFVQKARTEGAFAKPDMEDEG